MRRRATKPALPHALLLFFLTLGLPASAYAYVDPGAGSMLLQLLLGGGAGLLVLLRLFRERIYRFFGRRKKDPNE